MQNFDMEDVILYSIEVTADIAAKIRTLAESGVFAMKGGSCDIHFDNQGSISQVVSHTYRRIEKLSPGDHLTLLHE